jgi:hypothetical protein
MDKDESIFTEALFNLRKHAKRPRPQGDHIQVLHCDLKQLLDRYDMLAAGEFGPGKLIINSPTSTSASAEVFVGMPEHITTELIDAVREHDDTSVEDKDEWHKRLGWLICAYEVMIGHRTGRRRYGA